MPIEIRELVIRATVTDDAAREPQLEAQLARLKAELIEECLARVEERLERAAER